MRTRRYEIERDGGHVWTLVFEADTGQWFVETTGLKGVQRQTIEEFEVCPIGIRYAEKLDGAIYSASRDL